MRLFFSITLAISTALSLPPDPISTPHDKRAYSVKQGQRGLGTWPSGTAYGRGQQEDPRIGNKRPVRYCWSDSLTKAKLEPILEAAIQKWEPALRDTSLAVIVDPRAGPTGLCSEIPASPIGPHDALIISLEKEGKGSKTSVGYNFVPIYSEQPGRHSMEFDLTLNGQMDDSYVPASELFAEYVAEMTHELGHAYGLHHEHQRPDRDKYVKVHFENIEGFAEAKASLDSAVAPPPLKPTLSPEERLQLICSNKRLAHEHFEEAEDFVAGDPDDPYWAMFDYDDSTFDYNSIMLYNSYDGSRSANRYDVNAWTVLKRPAFPGAAPDPVEQGGSSVVKDQKPSARDAERLRKLYPPLPQQA